MKYKESMGRSRRCEEVVERVQAQSQEEPFPESRSAGPDPLARCRSASAKFLVSVRMIGEVEGELTFCRSFCWQRGGWLLLFEVEIGT
jgi:hypothetical protein